MKRPFTLIRERLNSGVSARVSAQLDWREAEIEKRLMGMQKSLESLRITLTTLQRQNTEAATTTAERFLALEAALSEFDRPGRQPSA